MAKFKNTSNIYQTAINPYKSYNLDDLENDEQFQEVAERFLSSIGEQSDDIFEYLRDSDFNLFSGMKLAMDSGKFSEQQKQDYAFLRQKFDGADIGSFNQFLRLVGDGIVDIATDPTAVVAALSIPFTGGASAATREAISSGVRRGIQASVAEKIKGAGKKQIAKAAGVNAAIGGVYTTADNHFRQTAQLNTNLRQAYSTKELIGMGLVGAAGGAALGAGAKYLQNRNANAVSKFSNDEYRDKIKSPGLFQLRKAIDKGLSRVGGSAASILNTLAEFSPTAKLLGQTFVDDFQTKILGGRLTKPTGYSFAEELDKLQSEFKIIFDAALAPVRKTGFLNKETETNILRILRGDKGQFSDVEVKTARRMRKLYDKIFKEAKEAGLPVNRVEDFFPRSWNRKAIQENEDVFVQRLFEKKAIKNDKGEALSKKEVAEVVEGMLNKNNDETIVASNLLGSKRIFDLNDLDFEEFLTNDLIEVSHSYMLGAARAIQHKKSFLLPGSNIRVRTIKLNDGKTKAINFSTLSNEEQFRQRFLDQIEREVKEKGGKLNRNDKKRIMNLYRSVTGQVDYFDSPLIQGIYDTTKLANAMAYLPLATLSSASELLIPLVKTTPDKASKALLRSITKGSKILREETIDQLTRKYPKMTEDQLLKEMRSVWIAMDESVGDVTNRLAGEGLQNKFAAKGARIFFRTNFLIPWTKTVQATAFSVGKDIIRDNLKKLRSLQKQGIDVLGDKAKYIRKISKSKKNFLQEFGEELSEARIENLKSELYSLNVDVEKGLRWLNKGAKETSEFYKNDLIRGAARFTNSVILQTGRERAKVPTYMTNPKIDILTQFLRYPYVFSNTIMKNFLKEAVDKPGIGASKLLIFNLLATNIALETNYWRTTDEIRKRREKEGVNREDILKAFQRTGMLGPLDLAERFRQSLKYGQNPTLAAVSLGGPVMSDVIGLTFYGRILEQLARKTPGYGSKELLKRITIPGTEVQPLKPVGEAYDDWISYSKKFDKRLKEGLKNLQKEEREVYFKGGEVSKDVQFVKDEAENRIDPLTGLPYAIQSDITIDSILREERKERLGLAEGGEVDEKQPSKFNNPEVENIEEKRFTKLQQGFQQKLRNNEFTEEEQDAAFDKLVADTGTKMIDLPDAFMGVVERSFPINQEVVTKKLSAKEMQRLQPNEKEQMKELGFQENTINDKIQLVSNDIKLEDEKESIKLEPIEQTEVAYYDSVLNSVQEIRGFDKNESKRINDFLERIIFQESDNQNIQQKLDGGRQGPGQGYFQIENSKGSGTNRTIIQSIENYYGKNPNAPISAGIQYMLTQKDQDFDFSRLSRADQKAAVLMYLSQRKGFSLGDLASGKLSFRDAWVTGWQGSITEEDINESIKKWDATEERYNPNT